MLVGPQQQIGWVGMHEHWAVDLPVTADAGACARQAVVDHFADELQADALVDVQIVATELVTYGLDMGSGFLRLRGWVEEDDGAVCLEVAGGDGRAAASLPADLNDVASGWGPRLIDRLAQAWEVREGASVWVRLHEPHSVATVSVGS